MREENAVMRLPSTLSASEREIWEREAVLHGYLTESTHRLMEEYPQADEEADYLYLRRIEFIRRHEASLASGRTDGSQNARTHGLSAAVFRLLPEESEEAYAQAVGDALRRYNPLDSLEMDQVVVLVNASWLLRRVQSAASDAMCKGLEEGTRACDGVIRSADALAGLSRYEGNVNRSLDKARKRLRELREEHRTQLFKREDSEEPKWHGHPAHEYQGRPAPEPPENERKPRTSSEHPPHASRPTPNVPSSPAEKITKRNPEPLSLHPIEAQNPSHQFPLTDLIREQEKKRQPLSTPDVIPTGGLNDWADPRRAA